MTLDLAGRGRQRLRVLCIGAHCDDIEIGCGGTLLHLQRARPGIIIDWLVLSGNPARRAETVSSMRRFVRTPARGSLHFGDFPDARFPSDYSGLKDCLAQASERSRPDIVFTHCRHDAHQDHRVLNELAWGAFRDQIVLEYEIPKWDGDLRTPQIYVPLTKAAAARKIAILMGVYASQRSRDWFARSTFEAMLRLRGVECRARSGYAEGFFARKLVLFRN